MNEKPTILDTCAGIGGFSLAFESAGFETAGFVECDEIKRIVLRHWWPGEVILPDMRDTAAVADFCRQAGGVDVITGGIPCQPTSSLGQQRGTADERWLWPDAIRLVGAIRPRFAVYENPPALLALESGRAFNGIVSGLVSLGYDLWWDVFPAAAFGAGHLRERLIIVAADARHAARTPERQCNEMEREQFGGEFCQIRTCEAASDAAKRSRIPANETDAISQGRHSWESDVIGNNCHAPHLHRQGLQGHAGDENRRGWGAE